MEWRTVYILTGELLETVKRLGLEAPVPWIVGECASSCLGVLTNPLHKLYGKVNKFLQKAPSWEVEKLPSYWIDKILLHEPDLDDGYYEEISWLLDIFIKGLRTKTVSLLAPLSCWTFANGNLFPFLGRTWKSIVERTSLSEFFHSTNLQR